MQRRQKMIAPNHETRTKTRKSEQFFTNNDQFCTNNLLILYEIYMYVWTEAGPQKPPRVILPVAASELQSVNTINENMSNHNNNNINNINNINNKEK
jgi:hypothetical protein